MIDTVLDLAGLTDRPENIAKVFKRESRLGRVILGLVMDRKISSANNDILCEVPATSTLVMSGWVWSASAKGSSARINRSGESGHPCCALLSLLGSCTQEWWRKLHSIQTGIALLFCSNRMRNYRFREHLHEYSISVHPY